MTTKRTRMAIFGLLLVGALLFIVPVWGVGDATAAFQGDEPATVTLTLLHNNDGESKLLPDPDGGFPGISRFAQAWIDEGRSSDADILVRVSSGDNFLASKEFSAGMAQEGELYDSLALRGLYEAMGFGNHDFDFGPDVTARFIEGFRVNDTAEPVTFVGANVDVSGEFALQALADEGRIARSVVWTDPRSNLDVGIVGALTPRLPNISSPRNVIVDADIAGAVNAEVQRLAESGVDRIVLVSHLQGLDEDRDLVPLLSGVDIVVAGGGDELLKNVDDDCLADEDAVGAYPLLLTDADGVEVPVVTAPGGYRCFGRLDVTFDDSGDLVEFSGSSIGVSLDGDSEPFAKLRVEDPLTEALALLNETVVGESEVDLDGRRSSVRTGSSNVGQLLADALLTAGQGAPEFGGLAPSVAIQNGGGIRNDALISAGTITEADTFDIAPFANFVVTGEVSRERFKEVLEVALSGLPDAEGTFPQIAGFTMNVDAAQPARGIDRDNDCEATGESGARVVDVTLDDGTKIVEDGEVVPGDPLGLATIDFLAGGGDCYPLGDLAFTKVGLSYQQALSDYIGGELQGQISADRYGQDVQRIAIASGGSESDDSASEDSADDSPDSTSTDGATDDPADASGTDDSTSDDDTGADGAADDPTASADDSEADLPRTGTDTRLFVVLAMTAASAGALVGLEARRAGRLSLKNRLWATSAWFPDHPEQGNPKQDNPKQDNPKQDNPE